MVASLAPVLTPPPTESKTGHKYGQSGKGSWPADYPGSGLIDRLGKYSLIPAIGLCWEGVFHRQTSTCDQIIRQLLTFHIQKCLAFRQQILIEHCPVLSIIPRAGGRAASKLIWSC